MKAPAGKNRWALPLIIVAGTALIYLMTARKSEVSSAPLRPALPSESSLSAPDFSLPLLGGGTASLSQYRGKVVLLDFWASWCPPCKREIPDFVDLQRRYGAQGLQVIGVALDEPAPVRAFAEGQGINYPILMGDDGVTRLYGGITGIPTTFLIDRNGRVVRKYEGYHPPAVFEKDAAALL